MQVDENSSRKYVFVCGLARSGTSLLGRNIARLKDCSGFKNTGVFEDEGQFLQDVYATASAYGGSSRCGFDPRAHRTETSDLLTPDNVARLKASWHTHWDNTKTIFVEKTPENLLMTRFLQAAFPNSYFVVMTRHPVPVSIAGQKWKINYVPLHRMFAHWLRCHEIFAEDKPYLKRVYELTYEEYVENTPKCHREIAAFLGTTVPPRPKEDTYRYVAEWGNPEGRLVWGNSGGRWVPDQGMEQVSGAHNQKYFERCRNSLQNLFFKSYYGYIARKYEPRFAKYGYSLTKDLGLSERMLHGTKVSNAVGALCCLGADAGALTLRLSVRANVLFRVIAKAVLPAFVVSRIRQARKRQSLNKEIVEARG